MDFSVQDFNYNLPPELIAQKPVRPRDSSRLLVLDKKSGEMEHKYFFDLVDYLQPGDLLILNNSKVFPARLIGHKIDTGGEIEIFLHKKLDVSKDNFWECLVRGRVKVGSIIDLNVRNDVKLKTNVELSKKKHKLQAEIIFNNEDGTWQVKFNCFGRDFFSIINEIGEVPLPPYIKRSQKLSADLKNYQNVFADESKLGSVAAPTAGLHFTEKLLKKISDQGVSIEYVTLHVGLGTFAPVKTEKISDHKMHSELASIESKVIEKILSIKRAGGRVIAVGTTSCRVLESVNWTEVLGRAVNSDWVVYSESGSTKLKSQSFWTDIFIYPGYEFKVVDALITNFHLPKSTLIMLLSAFAGKDQVAELYQEAIRLKYRFFSYGDATFIY